MKKKQYLIKTIAVLALGMVLYTLRPMPEYDLYARTAAGMYEQDPTANEQTLSILYQQSAILSEELNSAMALLEMKTLPDQAKTQLSEHLLKISTASADMQKQLIKQFGEPRLSEMINLPIWATETLALVQVIKQIHNHDAANQFTAPKLRTLKGDLQWVEQALADLKNLIRQQMPAFKMPVNSSAPLN